MADLGTATIQCTLGAGYIDTSEAERLEGEIAGKDAEIAALEAKVAQLEKDVENAAADVTAEFVSVLNRTAENLELPESLTEIGNSAFRNCRTLKTITLPAGLTSIGSEAFSDCSKLAEITLPMGVTIVMSYTFSSCNSLSKVNLPETVTSIESSAFQNCIMLNALILPAQLKKIGGQAFSGCAFTQMEFPETLTSLGGYLFMNSGTLASVTFKGVPTNIATNAFGSIFTKGFTINVPWAEGEVSGAPWGATNATINYNYTGGDT